MSYGDSPRNRAGPEAVYRLLLHCYPADVRRQFGDDMLDVFRDMCEVERQRRGWVGVLSFSLRAYTEVPMKAAEAWTQARGGVPGRRGVVESVAGDVRFALRTLRKRPVFTTVAVLTLGLGIGAVTAMFSVVDAVLIKGLEYRDHARLVTVWQVVPGWRDVVNLTDYWDKGWLSYEQYRMWVENGDRAMEIAIHDGGGMTLTGLGEPERLAVGEASASLLRVLGAQPVLGRWFLPEEEGTEANASRPVVVLSHEFWQRKFGGDPDMIGGTLTSSERSYTIVGVLPRGFRLRMLTAKDDVGRRDVWVPLEADQGYHWEAIGRLAPSVSIEQAQAVARSVLLPQGSASDRSISLVPRKESEILGFGGPLVLLLGATGLLMVIACANVATLSLGEVLRRRHEMATRVALGASGLRLMRQLLTESVVLGILGSAVGVVLAVVGTRMLVALAPPIPRLDGVVVDHRVLAFAALLGVLAGLLFGTVLPMMSLQGAVGDALRSGTRGNVMRREAFTRSLSVTEIALTVVILVAGGLLTRSLVLLMNVNPGFDSDNLVVIHALPPNGRYSSQVEEMAFYGEVLDQIRAIPGVSSATAANGVPFVDGTSSYQVRVLGGEGDLLDAGVSALGYRVGPGYFGVTGVPIIAGRGISESNGPTGPLVAVVSASMARRCWPRESPIGARFQFLGNAITVIGVAGDVRHEMLDREPVPTFYVPAAQSAYGDANFVARTGVDARHVIPLIREAVWSVDQDVAIVEAGSLASFIARSANYERYRTLLMTVFGVTAALLAAAGVLGVTARAVAQRTREMGIRMALGARGRRLVGSTVLESLTSALAGTALGLLGAFWASRLLSRFLFGVAPSDPITYGAVGTLVIAVCLGASYVPARQIARVDPVRVMRVE